MRLKKLSIAICVAMVLSAVSSWAIDKAEESDRVENAAKVLNEITATPDKGIPESIMKNAKCVAVIPSLVKAGFVFGGQYGRGVASCRTANGWSAPAPILVGGGSWGLQIGGEAVDLVLLVMNDKGLQSLLNSKFKLGADASAAAGPVGRQAQADTDVAMKAEVLTYSRARGIFAGVTLNGAVVKQDDDATRVLYDKDATYQSILRGEVKPPSEAAEFMAALKKFSNQAETASATPHQR